MLFESLKQSYVFLGCLYFGLLCGIVYDFFKFILNLFGRKRFFQIVGDILFSFVFVILFFVCLNVTNYGEFRIFVLISYILGFFVEQKTLGFLVDFIFQKLYNFLRKVFAKLSKTKFFRRIFGCDTRKSKKTVKNR